MKRILIIPAALIALHPLADAIARGLGRGGGHGGGGMGQRPVVVRYQSTPDALTVNPQFPWTAHWGAAAEASASSATSDLEKRAMKAPARNANEQD